MGDSTIVDIIFALSKVFMTIGGAFILWFIGEYIIRLVTNYRFKKQYGISKAEVKRLKYLLAIDNNNAMELNTHELHELIKLKSLAKSTPYENIH